jgi:hypothetical protein
MDLEGTCVRWTGKRKDREKANGLPEKVIGTGTVCEGLEMSNLMCFNGRWSVHTDDELGSCLRQRCSNIETHVPW